MRHHAIAEDRSRGPSLVGLGGGALCGVAAGLLVGASIGGLPAIVLGGLLGITVGSLAGELIASRMSPEDWEPPATDRPNVGASAPDADATDP